MLFEEGKNKNTIPASPCQVAGHLLMANFQSIAAIMEGTDFQQGRCLIKGTFLGMQAAWLCVCLLGTCFFWVIPRQVTNSKSKSGSKNANALANRTHTDARWYESMFVTHMRCEPDDTNKKAIHEPELRHTTFHHIKSRTNTFHWTNISHQNTLLSIKIRGWTMFWPVLHTPLHRVILHVDAIHYIGFHCPLRHYILILTYKTQRIYTWFANYQ